MYLVELVSSWFASRFEVFREALSATAGQLTSVQIEDIEQRVGSVEAGAIVAGVAMTINGEPSARLAFERLVNKPLRMLRASGWAGQLVVAIDALDESLDPGYRETIVSLVSEQLDQEGLRFLLTTREDPRVLEFVGTPDLSLSGPQARTDGDGRQPGQEGEPGPAEGNRVEPVLEDVARYCRERVRDLPQPLGEELAGRIARAAGANFLYAQYVTEDVLAAPPDNGAELPLPSGLEDQYRRFLQRELGRDDEPWEERYRPLLGALAVARGAGMTTADLSRATGISASRTEDALRRCAQYLTEDHAEGRYAIYHTSFRDFLTAPGRFHVYPRETNADIAARYLARWAGRWWGCDEEYCLAHLVEHLVAAAGVSPETVNHDGFAATLGDVAFLETKAAQLGLGAVLGDLRLVEDGAPAAWLAVSALAEDDQHTLTRRPVTTRSPPADPSSAGTPRRKDPMTRKKNPLPSAISRFLRGQAA